MPTLPHRHQRDRHRPAHQPRPRAAAEEAARAAYEAARGYLNLELDLETGKRVEPAGERPRRASARSPAPSPRPPSTTAPPPPSSSCAPSRPGKEVIVSRGQLIEIGGSFRIPEIMAVSGATLREVGTTNITRLADYERAIGPNTAALMRVHTSNYRVRGFTKSVDLPELVELGRKHNLAGDRRRRQRAGDRLRAVRLPGEPLVSAEHRGRGRPRALQRRQAARRPAGRASSRARRRSFRRSRRTR